MRTGVSLAAGVAIAIAIAPAAAADHLAGAAAGATGVLPPAPPSPPPSISGSERVGQTLTGEDGGWDGPAAFSYQWLRCDGQGSSCVFAHDTDLSYVLGSVDLGKTVRLRVRADRITGSREVDSAPTGPIAGPLVQAPTPVTTRPAVVRPSNLAPPAVIGTLREGEIIGALPGRWSGSGPLRFTNRWERCDADGCAFTGQTGFLTRLVRADVGKRMRAVVTASNSAGAATAPSARSAIVKPKLRRISPFPVVEIRGVIARHGTYVSRLAVRAPRGSTLRLTCHGRGCPYRRATMRSRHGLVVVRSLHARTLAVDTTLSLSITQGERIGKYTRFRVRRRGKPARVDRCLVPGKGAPSRCR